MLVPTRNYSNPVYRYGFQGQEKDNEIKGIGNSVNYKFRMYDPSLGRWLSMDPLAEVYNSHSPYNYGLNNSIFYVDPDGRGVEDVIIKGNKSKEVFNQLNASTSLKLKIDDNGKVTAKGRAKTDADKTLLEAINSTTVEVNINATDSNFTSDGKWFVGGAFGGSKVKNGKTITNQTVNPEQAKKIDNFYGVEKGVTVLHEVLESYFGGKDSPGIGSPTFADVQNKTATGVGYEKAHNKAKKADPRHVSPNIIVDKKGIFISKFPYSPSIPKALNPEILINDLKK